MYSRRAPFSVYFCLPCQLLDLLGVEVKYWESRRRGHSLVMHVAPCQVHGHLSRPRRHPIDTVGATASRKRTLACATRFWGRKNFYGACRAQASVICDIPREVRHRCVYISCDATRDAAGVAWAGPSRRSRNNACAKKKSKTWPRQ